MRVPFLSISESKISDLTRDIILNEPVKSIINSAHHLNNQLNKKIQESARMSSIIDKKESNLVSLTGTLTDAKLNFDHLKNLIKELSNDIEKIEPEIVELKILIQNIVNKLYVINKRLSIVSLSKANYNEKKQSLNVNSDAKDSIGNYELEEGRTSQGNRTV